MKAAIIGCGLIGGSMAIDLKKANWISYCYGVDNDPRHTSSALAYKWIDEAVELSEAVSHSDIILLAVPVKAIKNLLPSILDMLNDEQVVVDFGSTKFGISQAVKNHPRRKQFVAAHPIAGTENTGPSAAFSGLFTDKVNIICDRRDTGLHAIDVAASMFRTLGMKTIFMESEAHDRHIAYVSHLSHISSFMLGKTVLDIEQDERNIFNMAGSGFQSTVRLAMSSPDMWTPIFEQNSANVSQALGEYINHLQEFKKHLDEGNTEGMRDLMIRANEIRRVLGK